MHIQILYGVNGEREVVKIKIRIIICIVIFVLCLFLFKTIITMKFHSLFEPVHITEEWLKLHSPDGDYTILVDSVRTVSEFDLRRSNEYKLNIYVKKEKTESHRKYYFSTIIEAVEEELKEENYEIVWLDKGALFKLKDKKRELTYIMDFRELFQEKNR